MSSKINIDFKIYDEDSDPTSFVVYDNSNWLHIKDKPSIIEIIVPGNTEPVVNYFDKNAFNIINSIKLGLSCSGCKQEKTELPDGIYEITVKGSPDKFRKHKSYLRVNNLYLRIDKILVGLSLECYDIDEKTKLILDELDKVDFLIKGASANVRYGNDCIAQKLLFEAQSIIDRLEKCKTCY